MTGASGAMRGSDADRNPPNAAARVVGSGVFKGAVLGAILAGAVIVGLETVPSVHDAFGGALAAIDRVVLAIFVIEVVLKIAAEGRRPWRYFADPWNVFDFAVTAICLLPLHAQFAQVLRLGRVARSLRLVTALPRLQLIVGALLRSLPSFGWITLLLFTLLYAYSVMGVFLFGENDPERFGSLWSSMLTMFSVLTLEGWFDVMQDQMRGLPRADGGEPDAQSIVSPLFFVSFILSGTMIFLNLLVGVIVNSMSEMPGAEASVAKKQDDAEAAAASPLPSLHAPGAEQANVTLLVERLARMESMLAELQAELRRRGGA
ncbi:MAG: ion transporter [Planctomycetaceae bacterium]|nr:ion transporter [Planctomycetaceae bacterium]